MDFAENLWQKGVVRAIARGSIGISFSPGVGGEAPERENRPSWD